MQHRFDLDGIPQTVWLVQGNPTWRVFTEAQSADVALQGGHENHFVLTLDGESHPVEAIVDGDTVHVHLDGRAYALRYRDPVELHATEKAEGGHDIARAPMPGGVLAIMVAVGAAVRAGDTLLTIESMKLETAIKASRDGTVETIHVEPGQTFERDAALVTLLRGER
jgi:3-methylcrotonyl-CoA carboxylase alpha subunit